MITGNPARPTREKLATLPNPRLRLTLGNKIKTPPIIKLNEERSKLKMKSKAYTK